MIKTKDLPWDDREHLFVTIDKFEKEGVLEDVFRELNIRGDRLEPSMPYKYENFFDFWRNDDLRKKGMNLIAIYFDCYLSYEEQDALIKQGGI